MQLIDEKNKFDYKSVEQMLRNEDKFITEIFSLVAFPERDFGQNQVENEEVNRHVFQIQNKKSRAKSLEELKQRLVAITSNKKRLTYKEKLTKKAIKNKVKKKSQQHERNANRKLLRAETVATKSEGQGGNDEGDANTGSVPVFNKEDKMVFSKIDFANLGKQKKVKQEKDPRKILKKLEEENQKLLMLKEKGDNEKAVQIKEKHAWKNALARAEGQKVKDDPELLMKSIKKKEQKQRASKKKWEQRLNRVEKDKKEKQQKRSENIQKRKKDKKTTKIKKAVKKGKVIPGY